MQCKGGGGGSLEEPQAVLECAQIVALAAMNDRSTYFYLKEILGRSIDLLEALCASIGHCLHDCE